MNELHHRAWLEDQRCYAMQGDYGWEDLAAFTHSLDALILERFTGFRDCANKDIYQGDILRAWLEGSVEQAGGFWTHMYVRPTTDDGFVLWGERTKIEDAEPLQVMLEWLPWEVVGNIHENADLLTS